MTKRVTANRLQQLQAELRPIHQEVLRHLQATRLLTGVQLEELGSTDEAGRRATRRAVRSLVDWEVIARLDRRIGGSKAGSGSFVYALDIAGQRLTDPNPASARWRRPWTPAERTLKHDLAVSDLYVQLRTAEQHDDLDLIGFESEPAAWRTYPGPGGVHQVLKPDASIILGTDTAELHTFVEIDRATESIPTIQTKAAVYSNYWATGRHQASTGVFPIVLWIAPDNDRADKLRQVLGRIRVDDQQLHWVTTDHYALTRLLDALHPGDDQVDGVAS